MCYSSNVSIASFTIGMTFSFILFKSNEISYKIIGVSLMFAILMQFIEFLLWNHQVCDKYNKIISISGMIFNHLTPVMVAIIILTLTKQTDYNKKIILIVTAIYLLFIIPYSMQYLLNKNLQCTVKVPGNPYLLWNWLNMPYIYIISFIYLLTLVILIYIGIPDVKLSSFFNIILVGSLLLSYIIYPRPYLGSLWCYFGAFLPVLTFLYKKYIDKK